MTKKDLFKKVLSCTAAEAMLCASAAFPQPVSAEAAETATVANPIIWSDVPDDDVIRVGDTYYMVSTTMYFSPGAPIMKSKDLVSWELCNYVYDTLAEGDVQCLKNGKHDYSHGQWAASLRYHDGFYYVFFGSYGTGKSYIYKTDDIENGTWTRSELNGMYHDASMIFDDDGRSYLVYGGGGEIKIKEFNSEMTDFRWGGVDQTIFKTGLTGLAGEGSHIQKIGDYYYVFIIAWPNGSGRTEYCYRSKSITGPYEGKVVLNSGLGTYGSGVAQGGIVDTPDGKWYGMLFQDHGAVGRIPVLVPVTWQDDWPIMGVGGKAPVTLDIDSSYKGTFLAKDDDFSYSSNKLALEWQWNHNPDNESWSVTEREGWLRLKNNNIASNLLAARNTLTMRTEGPGCTSIIKLDASNMKPGDRAGLSAFQRSYGQVGVLVEDDGSKKVYMANNGNTNADNVLESRDNIIEQVPMNGDEVYLRIDFKFNNVDDSFNVGNNIDKANFFYSFDGNSWTKIGKELSMSYDLKLFTGYKSGIYSYPTRTTGGWADIDFFDYEREEWNTPVVFEPDENGHWFRSTFESGMDGWTNRGSASAASVSSASFEGGKSAAVTEREASWNGLTRTLSGVFKPGEEYSFSANVMYDGDDETDEFYMKLEYTGTDDEVHYDPVATGIAPKGKWVQLANTGYKIPEGATNMHLYIETAESVNSFYVDDVVGAVAGTVVQGAEPPIAEDPVIPGDINGDGTVSAFDMVYGRSGLVSEGEPFTSKAAFRAADVNGDGEYTVADLVQIEEFLLGKITSFTRQADDVIDLPVILD